MRYLKTFRTVSQAAEEGFLHGIKRTCYDTFYPFQIFPQKGLQQVEFDNITLFYGGNGSGKSTLLNVIAAEIGADAVLLAKNIDGVYSAGPHVDPSAVKYDAITYDEVLAKHLAVMDLTATSLAMENDIPVVVFALADPQNIVRAVMGEPVGTVVTK